MQTDALDQLSDMNKLELDGETKNHLMSMSKWTRFIAATIMAVLLLFLLLIITLGKELVQGMEESWSKLGFIINLEPTTAIVIFSAGIVFFIITYFFLLQFSNKTKKAIPAEHTEEWIESIRSLRLFFTLFAGISILGVLFAALTLFNILNG